VPVPKRLDAVATMLVGTRISEASARDAIAEALRDIEPLSDLHASAEYRRRAAESLALRAVLDANAASRRRGPDAR
jgi:CO/xanthine dehydrogenase FAD-binding subunit